MPRKGRTDAQIFELMALGLTWVQAQSSPPPSGWTGNGILQTLRLVGGITDEQVHFLTEKGRALPESLRNYFTGRAELIWPARNGRPPRGEIGKQIAQSKKPLIVVLNARAYDANRIFKPEGYRLMVSVAGLRYAASIEDRWAQELPRDTFWGQWNSRRRQMSGMHAVIGQANPADRG